MTITFRAVNWGFIQKCLKLKTFMGFSFIDPSAMSLDKVLENDFDRRTQHLH